MSSFDAIFLHKVMDYTRGARPQPDIPDFKELQRRLAEAQVCSDHVDMSDEIKGIASDFDFDESIEQYIGKSYDTMDALHGGIRDACADLSQNWDPDNMDREQMVKFVENLRDRLEEHLPESVLMRDVSTSWFGYDVGTFIREYHALNNIFLSYRAQDDMYHSYMRDEKMGRLDIKVGQNGVLTLQTEWKPGKLVFTSDKKIVLATGKPTDKVFAMPLVDFQKNFEFWTNPTEEEIALFDVLYPGADWTVMRYLRDYHDNNYVTNKHFDMSKLVFVNTTL